MTVVLILLPPSEGKTDRARGRPLDLARLSFPELTPTRERVLAALARVSTAPDAAHRLGVSPRLTEEIARNTRLDRAPARPAGQVYSGVLYDALDLPSLEGAARRRASRWVVVTSALFGAVRLGDPIPPYRLSMSVSLEGLGPLAATWRPVLDGPLTQVAGAGIVLDCRSSTYAAAWSPTGGLAERWVHVRVPGATHQAKHTRGLVTRHLLRHGSRARRPEGLPADLEPAFATDLTPPARAGRPWVLDVTSRG